MLVEKAWIDPETRQGSGVFMLTSMGLVRSGLCLSKEVYTQGTLTLCTVGKEAPGGTHIGNGGQ